MLILCRWCRWRKDCARDIPLEVLLDVVGAHSQGLWVGTVRIFGSVGQILRPVLLQWVSSSWRVFFRGELFITVGLFHYGGSFGGTVVGLVSLRYWGDSLIFSSNKIYLYDKILLTMNVIECNGIVKQFGNYRALDNVSIAVPEGKIFGLLGPNGAGKTTLIRIINQITIPDAGQVYFGGNEAQPDDVYKIGYLPEERGLYKKMKVGEQAMYLARLKGMTSAQAEKELKKWFVKFGIQSWWGKKVEELSKGMAQKVQFITTVLHQPKLLILDEPFSGFDPVNAQLIRDEILALKANGTSIILSTHNMESVEALCDEIALINKSKLIVTGGVDEIRREHGQNQVELIYRGSEPLPLKESEFVLNAYDEEFKGNRRAIIEMERDVKSGAVLADILKQTQDIISFKELIPSMNDIFIKLVSGEAK